MKYNLFVKTKFNTFNILDISDQELDKVINTYNYGKESIFIQGTKYIFSTLTEIQIYTFEHEKIKTAEEFRSICQQENLYALSFGGTNFWIPKDILNKTGKKVTSDFIKEDFGHLKENLTTEISNDGFVDLERIIEIEKIENIKFDLTKLIAFLKELNTAYLSGSFLSIPMLIRSIIDHVPPLFNKANFSEVTGSYGTRSFRDSMMNLDKSSRKIADSFLHTPIRQKENLPTRTQINFKQDIDVLLQEIVRINKK